LHQGQAILGIHGYATEADGPITQSPDYEAKSSRFTGRIHWVQIDLGDDDHDHFIDPEERLRIALSRQ
jgi:hypothetical protein